MDSVLSWRQNHRQFGTWAALGLAIAMQVKGDKVSCIINGTAVKTFDKSDLVVPGKLKSTDGTYGIRFSRNTDATVTDLKVTKR
jgi:hypothetical protein